MRTRIPTLAPRARQRGIGFLVVVLVLGLATITAGAGVTVYKISQGQTPSLEIQMGIKEGKIKLKVDPELGASLASNALTEAMNSPANGKSPRDSWKAPT